MCKIIGQILSVEKGTRKTDGQIYYVIKFLLTDNKVSTMFFNDSDLYERLLKVDRLSDLEIICDIKYFDERTFRLIPKSFEM